MAAARPGARHRGSVASLQRYRGRFILQWSDALGQHKRVIGRIGVLPEKEAAKILRAKQYELDTGRAVLVGRQITPFFDDFVLEYLEWHRREYPSSHYRVRQIVDDHLLDAFRDKRLAEIVPEDVEKWKQDRGREVRGASVVKELRTLKAIVNKAVEWKRLAESPLVHVDAPRILDSKPLRFYTEVEVGKLLETPNAAIWRLYVNTGMRRMEGLILRREWVRPGALQILSTAEDRTKSGKWREIPLSAGAEQALSELKGEDGYVLPRMRPESLSRCAIRDAKRAGLDGGIHTLRHTYISHLVMRGVPLRTVQVLAGHSHVHVTEGYAHLTPDHLGREAARLSF